jgi:hypothetical protein
MGDDTIDLRGTLRPGSRVYIVADRAIVCDTG